MVSSLTHARCQGGNAYSACRRRVYCLGSSGAVSMTANCAGSVHQGQPCRDRRASGCGGTRRGERRALRDRSHRTHTCPHLSREMEERIIALRQVHPTKGLPIVLAQNCRTRVATSRCAAKSTDQRHSQAQQLAPLIATPSAKHTPYSRASSNDHAQLWQMASREFHPQTRCHPLRASPAPYHCAPPSIMALHTCRQRSYQTRSADRLHRLLSALAACTSGCTASWIPAQHPGATTVRLR